MAGDCCGHLGVLGRLGGVLGVVECYSVGCEAGDSAGAISDMAMGEPGSSCIADGWALIWGMLGSHSMAVSASLIIYNMAVGELGSSLSVGNGGLVCNAHCIICGVADVVGAWVSSLMGVDAQYVMLKAGEWDEGCWVLWAAILGVVGLGKVLVFRKTLKFIFLFFFIYFHLV